VEGSSRRNFFRLAASEAARGAREVIPLVDPLAKLAEGATAEAPEAAPPVEDYGGRTAPATPATHSASVEEMLAIAAELGLGARTDDLQRLAAPSTRLAPAVAGDGSSFTGGEPAIPATIEVPSFEDGTARFVALLDLPEGDRLWIFRAVPGDEDGERGESAASAMSKFAAALEPAADQAANGPIEPPPEATSLSPSTELTLPPARSTEVEALRLAREESDAWQELRFRLAASQGVPLAEHASANAAIHRLGGFLDTPPGDMPQVCELLLLGVDLEGEPIADHPLAGVLGDAATDWRPLAQLSADEELGWSWGPGYQRLYVWGRRDDPASSGYDSVQVVVR
jgi:hypothetical protein